MSNSVVPRGDDWFVWALVASRDSLGAARCTIPTTPHTTVCHPLTRAVPNKDLAMHLVRNGYSDEVTVVKSRRVERPRGFEGVVSRRDCGFGSVIRKNKKKRDAKATETARWTVIETARIVKARVHVGYPTRGVESSAPGKRVWIIRLQIRKLLRGVLLLVTTANLSVIHGTLVLLSGNSITQKILKGISISNGS